MLSVWLLCAIMLSILPLKLIYLPLCNNISHVCSTIIITKFQHSNLCVYSYIVNTISGRSTLHFILPYHQHNCMQMHYSNNSEISLTPQYMQLKCKFLPPNVLETLRWLCIINLKTIIQLNLFSCDCVLHNYKYFFNPYHVIKRANFWSQLCPILSCCSVQDLSVIAHCFLSFNNNVFFVFLQMLSILSIRYSFLFPP